MISIGRKPLTELSGEISGVGVAHGHREEQGLDPLSPTPSRPVLMHLIRRETIAFYTFPTRVLLRPKITAAAASFSARWGVTAEGV